MSRMVGELFAGSDLIRWPLLASILFAVIFAGVIVRALTRRDGLYERLRALPLDGERVRESRR